MEKLQAEYADLQQRSRLRAVSALSWYLGDCLPVT